MISEKSLLLLYQNAVQGIYQTTREGRFLTVNPTIAVMLGYDSTTDLIQSITDIGSQLYVEPDRRQQFIDEIEKRYIVNNFISQINKKDKTKIWISENARIVCDETGNVLYYEGFISDITALKQVEEQINSQLKRQFINEKMESIELMARGFGHDLNNMLSPILGYAELLLEFFPNEEKMERYLQNIIRSTKKARDLIGQIHSIGKPEKRKSKPLHISSLINEIINQQRTKHSPNIHITQKIENDIPYILGNPSQIHQILNNMIENAIQTMENIGGELTVTLRERNLTANDIHINSLYLDPGSYLEIILSDTGDGIQAKNIHCIFDPYFITRNDKIGHGFGLATVYSLVRMYNGDIKVKSNPGNGTTFNIYLPAYKTDVTTNYLPADKNPSRTQKHIMLIDDDDDILKIQKQLVEYLGYKVTAFNESQLALEAFSNNPQLYDLILTDMNMPELTGLALSKLMLQINSDIPIILCTGYAESINEATIKSVGIKKFILKPLTAQKLSNDLKTVLKES
ncbi:response regulator [candidate division KSB1 bacterium]|nr:response regulator [candidate division KSB1 bacterium]